MSLIVIPLAGPDFYTQQYGIRPLYPIGNTTLIEYVLTQRSWMQDTADNENQIVFILREEKPHTDKMRIFIAEKFPAAHTVTLSYLSAGAPLSALAGIALSCRNEMPVIVDLADIAFDMPWDPTVYFYNNGLVDAVVPYFSSTNPKFSYLKLDGNTVIEAREKQPISLNASAGVYIFRDITTYLRSIIYCLKNPQICKIGSAFFVCPSVNGLITEKRQVHAIKIHNVEPISSLFHE